MALSLYRISQLPTRYRDLIERMRFSEDELDQIESGQIPESVKSNPELLKSVQDLITQLPKYEDILKTTENEADLTDQELQGREEAFQQINKKQILTQELDKNKLITYFTNIFKEAKFPGSQKALENRAIGLADYVIENGDLPPHKDLHEAVRAKEREFRQLLNDPNYFKESALGISGDVSEDIKRIQEDLSTRRYKTEREQAAESYLTQELPSALTAAREDYLGGQTERALAGYREDIVPRDLARLNVRGILRSGERESSLTASALGVQSELDQLRASAEFQDYEFLGQAAYRSKVRQLLEGVTDYRSALLGQRNTALQEQGYRFGQGEADINRKFQETMANKNYELQLSQQQAQLRRQNEQASRNQSGETYNQLAQLGGQAIGGFITNQFGGQGTGGTGGGGTGGVVPAVK